jgi:hypothetical protein
MIFRISEHLTRGIKQAAYQVLIPLRGGYYRVVVMDRNSLLIDNLLGRRQGALGKGLARVGGGFRLGLCGKIALDPGDLASGSTDLLY